jgi:transposase
MESTLPQVNATSELALVNQNGATPFSQQTVVLTKQAYIELKWKANDWQAQYERLLEREAALKAEVAAHEATIRDLTQRLSGTKSEKSSGADSAGESKPGSPRNRGQQPGRRGHGRSDRSALPVVAATRDLRAEAKHCPACGEAYLAFPGTEESTIIEVQVQAHIRRIQRPRYQRGCQCLQVSGMITAPPAPRLIAKSPLGVSVWTMVLLDTDLYGRPTHRFCEALRHCGLCLAQGTVTDGLNRIAPLVEPVVAALLKRQRREKLFHGDETRWEVCEEVEGKTGHRWYLGVTRSASVVCYRMAPGRGADVPKAHVADLQKDLVNVVLVCDRSSAYTCLAKGYEALMLAYCWAHVRRDFLKAAHRWPELGSWMFTWVEDIRDLYRLHAARLEGWDDTLPVHRQSSAFAGHHLALRTTLRRLTARCEAYLQDKDLHHATAKVLTSLHNHWEGLTVFLARPEVAMDNNAAERGLRGPVVGRKNYYGSGSVWSAHLAAMMLSVLHTVVLWELNPHHWLTAFLQACADHGGTSPTDLSAFLPWKMTPERKRELAQPMPVT